MINIKLTTLTYESPSTRELKVEMNRSILDVSSRNAEAKGFNKNWDDDFWGEGE
jgi:hypothetical protein